MRLLSIVFSAATCQQLTHRCVARFISLVDVDECRESDYEMLADPADGQSMFTRAFRVDDNGKADLVAEARSVGDTSRCGTCTGENGMLARGFRAEVNGVVTALADGETPATLQVTSAVNSNDKATICGADAPVRPAPIDSPNGNDSNVSAVRPGGCRSVRHRGRGCGRVFAS